jgi:uncharacterized protein (DUF1499 family)
MRPFIPAGSRCIGLVLLLAGCSSAPRITGDIEELPSCGALPNCVNTQSGQGIHAGEPIQANAAQWQQLKNWIGLQDDWQILSESPDFIHAVVTTPVMKFQDDVHLLYVPEDQLIQVRSSSRVGISDLGANARRLGVLRDQVRP